MAGKRPNNQANCPGSNAAANATEAGKVCVCGRGDTQVSHCHRDESEQSGRRRGGVREAE